MGWMMAGMLTQLPLPLLPAGAAELAPGVGLVTGTDGGGLVSVHGLATFAWDAGDEAGRRLAAVQLVRLRAVSQAQAAAAFGVDPVTVWRWDQALASGGVAGLVPARRGPKGASKLTPELAARIRELDAAGARLSEIAAATGVSTFSVRNALGRVAARGRPVATAAEQRGLVAGDDEKRPGTAVPVLPDPVPRDGERALARWGLLGEGAEPVFVPGARYPLAGLLLALPALEATGLLAEARQVYGRLKDGFYGLAATLLTLAFLAMAGEPRAEGATRVPPAGAGPGAGTGPGAGGQDDPPQAGRARRGRRGGGPDHGAGPPARRRPPRGAGVPARRRARPRLLRHPEVQKTHIARLKFPAPATGRPGSPSADGEPVFMVVAEPSDSLAGELRRLLPQLRQVVGEARRVTVCFDRGGWSPALFADITGAGFDLLTWRKGPAPDLPAAEFTTVTCADDRGRQHAVRPGRHHGRADHQRRAAQGADGQPAASHPPRPREGRRHPADPRPDHPDDLAAGEVCWRLTSRWREENYFRYARTHFALDALDSYAASPTTRTGRSRTRRRKPPPPGPPPPRVLAAAAEAQRDAAWRPCATRPRPAGHHHQSDGQRPGRPGRGRLHRTSSTPRTPRRPSPARIRSAR